MSEIGLKRHEWGEVPLVGQITAIQEVTEETTDHEDPQRTRLMWTIQGEGAVIGRTWLLTSGMTVYPPGRYPYMPLLTRLVLALGVYTPEEVEHGPLPERDLEQVIGRRLQFALDGPYRLSQIDPTTIVAVP